MDIHDNLYSFIVGVSLVGTESILMKGIYVWLVDVTVAYDKPGMGSCRDIYNFRCTAAIPNPHNIWI